MTTRYLSAAFLSCFLFSVFAVARGGEGDAAKPNWLLPVPELRADDSIPSLREVVGYDWAADVSNHSQIERYLQALAKAAPDRAKLVRYGESYEGRALYYLVITSARNLKRLDEIRTRNLRLADPRSTNRQQAAAIRVEAPAVVWLGYSVHGNEISCSDSALLTAYHLLADRREETRAMLERLVVIIDPLQNPDGRERFINVYREKRGAFPDAEPWSSEHVERWSRGRHNHYLFDMNRDWFLHSQQETAAKVAAYLRWHPQVFVDSHEMGRNNTYYFNPPRDPVNPLVSSAQQQWFFRIGRRQASWFDRYGFAYTTREMFDAFYPGYGSEWPTLQGGLGILWEQAGTRGLVVRRDDETSLHYHDGVRRNYVSALATLEAAAEHRAELLAGFYEARAGAVELGRDGPVRHYFLPPGQTPGRTARLARTLLQNGIEVRRLTKPFKPANVPSAPAVPAGGFHVPVAQPSGRLARALLDRHTDMGETYVRRQIERRKRGLGHEIYDVTAWSLPLAFGVKCLATDDAEAPPSEAWDGKSSPGRFREQPPAKVAYLIPGNQDALHRALAWLLRRGVRVHVTDKPFELDAAKFPPGTLIVKSAENVNAGLHAAMKQCAAEFAVDVHSADSGFVTSGAHFGGPHVKWVRPPRVVMLMNRPAHYSAGHTWHLFDQQIRYPLTRVPGRYLEQVELSRYNVLVLPHGKYSGKDAPTKELTDRIRRWVEQGGALILVKGAAQWGATKDVALLPASPAKTDAAKKPDGEAESSAPPRPLDPAPGAFLEALVDNDHWITFGYGDGLEVFFNGNVALTPIPVDKGRNLVTFAKGADDLLASGFCWKETLAKLAGKPYVVYKPLKKGHVIAFADDPNYRAMYPALQRLFYNTVFFGPGH